MQFAIEATVVVGQDVARSQRRHLAQAGFDFLRATIEKDRRQVGAEPIAGEEIARKEQVKPRAVKAAMPIGMTGQMNDAQAAPPRQFGLGDQRLIDGNASVSEDPSPDCFHETADAAGPGVGKNTVDMALLQRMSQHRSAGEFLQAREIPRVIKMTVSQEQRLDVRPVQAALAENALQPGQFARQPGIDQHRFVLADIVQEVKNARQAADGINPKVGVD